MFKSTWLGYVHMYRVSIIMFIIVKTAHDWRADTDMPRKVRIAQVRHYQSVVLVASQVLGNRMLWLACGHRHAS